MSYSLSTDQVEAMRRIGAWYKERSVPYLAVGGYAGTGKTTLLGYVRQAMRDHDTEARVAFCAYTGKASRVLADRLRELGALERRDNVSTIHSLIYTAITDSSGHITGWEKRTELPYQLIIVDEASMVDESIWRDLLSFGLPVLAVGDHGQLPPINSSFNLMSAPDITLEQIHRQQAGSGIIKAANLARADGHIPPGDYGTEAAKLNRRDDGTGQTVEDLLQNYKDDLLVLCGYNSTRNKLNQTVRNYLGYEQLRPQPGDRVVALRNNRFSRVYNGATGQIRSLEREDDLWYRAEIAIDGEDWPYEGFIWSGGFAATESPKVLPPAPDGKPGDLFDFGYALTVHKAQGSQSPRVLLFEERFPRMTDDDWRRWLYTGVTRAAERLVVVG